MAGLSNSAKKFYELKKEKTALGSALKDLQKKLDVAEEELIEELSHEGLSRMDLQGQASFFIANRKFYKISDREALVDFLHEQGDTDLLTVQHQTLNAYAKEMETRKAAAGEDDFTLPGVAFITKTQIRVRKI